MLGRALAKNTTIRVLDLHDNPLGPDGVAAIVRGLREQLSEIRRERIPSPRVSSLNDEQLGATSPPASRSTARDIATAGSSSNDVTHRDGVADQVEQEPPRRSDSTSPNGTGRRKSLSGSREPSARTPHPSARSGASTGRSGTRRPSGSSGSLLRSGMASRMGGYSHIARKTTAETDAERLAVQQAREQLEFEAPLQVLNLSHTSVSHWYPVCPCRHNGQAAAV